MLQVIRLFNRTKGDYYSKAWLHYGKILFIILAIILSATIAQWIHLSLPNFLLHKVRIPSTLSFLFFQFVIELCFKRTKINKKRPGLAHIFETIVFLNSASPTWEEVVYYIWTTSKSEALVVAKSAQCSLLTPEIWCSNWVFIYPLHLKDENIELETRDRLI